MGRGQDKQGRGGRSGEWTQSHQKSEGRKKKGNERNKGVEGECRSGHKQGKVSATVLQ